MRRINLLAATMALAGMALSIPGTALAASAAQASGGSGGNSRLCQVVVNRTASPGVYDVTREERRNGQCVCRVTTGPASQAGSAESAVASIRTNRTCANAPLAQAVQRGGLGTGGYVGIGILLAGGLTAALLSGGSNSP